jgi:crossover junction endodeoxyribonuclease RuvC
MKNITKRIIGIDPGLALVGYAIVEGSKKNPIILDYGVLETSKGDESRTPYRLLEIRKDLEQILKLHNPTHAVVEKLFFLKIKKLLSK